MHATIPYPILCYATLLFPLSHTLPRPCLVSIFYFIAASRCRVVFVLLEMRSEVTVIPIGPCAWVHTAIQHSSIDDSSNDDSSTMVL